MERIVNLHIEKLPEGVSLATSDVIQGLVVQGRTIQEIIEIARDVAKKLLEAKPACPQPNSQVTERPSILALQMRLQANDGLRMDLADS